MVDLGCMANLEQNASKYSLSIVKDMETVRNAKLPKR